MQVRANEVLTDCCHWQDF